MACVVHNCTSDSSKRDQLRKLVTFHGFPKDEGTKQKWIEVVTKTHKGNWKWSKDSLICSIHFTDDCFVTKGYRWSKLNTHAVPTLNLICFSFSESICQLCSPVDSAPACEARGLIMMSSVSPPVVARPTIMNKTEPNHEIHPNSQWTCPDDKTEIDRIIKERLLEKIEYLERQLEQRSSVSAPMDVKQSTKNTDDSNFIFDHNYTSINMSDKDPTGDKETTKNLLEKIKRLDCRLAQANAYGHKLEKSLEKSKYVAKKRLKKINTLLQRTRRLDKRNLELHAVLENLLETEDSEHNKMLLKCIKNNKIVERYLLKQAGVDTPREFEVELKSFAVSLHSVSPYAYELVRNEFRDVLPHPNTILKWCKDTSSSIKSTNVDSVNAVQYILVKNEKDINTEPV